ncbi:1-acyl-sn-glycerol-3-phosphate acyltransferase [Canibacter sp. lx-72]|uniref:lysophospholipid acyltransferase family protein n=1 Tax=Canibacter zhuwentaonis TaxID=2837491 RepID=UPI001BDD52A4|nr:lysophospholipid acyltransferase family protein [Canibacter zhuwentaonis]MBT1018182.1 1-acyl-sn-glycerol-3-phosphate acyltransferase [Canibacter zhuwentaonis]MBT1035193.1 1-acyl-sn-glycerol-3-phosphate acyltransferase [Canibacter zhuwentaonis]
MATKEAVRVVKLKSISSAEKRKPSVFWLLAVFVLPFWNMSAKYRFTPGSKLPQNEPFILCPNHMSEIDPVAIGVATWKLGRLPRFMAKASLFRVPVLGWLMRASGQIPVERVSRGADSANHASSSTKMAKKSAPKVGPIGAASELISKRAGVIIYPEGTLTRDPDMWPMRGKSGAVRLALEGQIALYPAAHWGVQNIMPRYGKKVHLFKRKTICVAIGEPMNLEKYRGVPVTQELVARVTAELMQEITLLLAKLRGENAPHERWNPREHNQTEAGRF